MLQIKDKVTKSYYRIFALILIGILTLTGCSQGSPFETESRIVDLGVLKLIPWKIPEGVTEPIHIKNVKVEKPNNEYFLFTGEAINTGKKTAFGIDIVVQLYDKDKNGSGSVAELADPYQLDPGKTAKYQIRYYKPKDAQTPEYFDIHGIAAYFEGDKLK